MTNPTLKIISTADGSHSLHREDLNETYHSFHGAMGESDYVFIKAGLDYFVQKYQKNTVSVFEVGLGTGLNALLAANWSRSKKIKVEYQTIEPFPVPKEVYERLNYGEGQDERKKIFLDIHSAQWGTATQILPEFQLMKSQTTLEQVDIPTLFDVIFFDAFAPSKQPEVWSLENLQKCYALLNNGGIVTTYCAQGQFKRNLKSAGFEIEILPGAMGKKEMVRAHKS
ncbi:tRNA (5-methylaminomethyl-2-thiouridine)(34)-methyltransferase MnmD [Marinoscillum sp. MHG1-6]|uniref:tRNA (5-methylaminomethyl-2-thiouridine)(34)-methyltransferase MnmD n=1 Tax=Marinoscillum sp. MHG1-6 TaxID=2959627 RepID=UPI0021577715|nr:tRNA (5-methylaminomethyl-2-thiouridine)(34)-methyltransferase MnmD [Marinoscillum sp. MHG1-6]